MARPDQMRVERDGVSFLVGKNGDFSWAEMDALSLQIDRWNIHHPREAPIKKLSSKMIKAALEVKRVFPGAAVEDWA